MLLQTLVQLNILLLAAPALAGWVMSPVAHPMFAQAAQVVFLPAVRQAETTAQTTEERLAAPQAAKRPAVTTPFAVAASLADATHRRSPRRPPNLPSPTSTRSHTPPAPLSFPRDALSENSPGMARHAPL